MIDARDIFRQVARGDARAAEDQSIVIIDTGDESNPRRYLELHVGVRELTPAQAEELIIASDIARGEQPAETKPPIPTCVVCGKALGETAGDQLAHLARSLGWTVFCRDHAFSHLAGHDPSRMGIAPKPNDAKLRVEPDESLKCPPSVQSATGHFEPSGDGDPDDCLSGICAGCGCQKSDHYVVEPVGDELTLLQKQRARVLIGESGIAIWIRRGDAGGSIEMHLDSTPLEMLAMVAALSEPMDLALDAVALASKTPRETLKELIATAKTNPEALPADLRMVVRTRPK